VSIFLSLKVVAPINCSPLSFVLERCRALLTYSAFSFVTGTERARLLTTSRLHTLAPSISRSLSTRLCFPYPNDPIIPLFLSLRTDTDSDHSFSFPSQVSPLPDFDHLKRRKFFPRGSLELFLLERKWEKDLPRPGSPPYSLRSFIRFFVALSSTILFFLSLIKPIFPPCFRSERSSGPTPKHCFFPSPCAPAIRDKELVSLILPDF